MMRAHLIRQPRITEKGTAIAPLGKYVFEVDNKATKPEVKKAVEKRYNVHVVSVNIVNLPAKPKRSRGRAYATSLIKKAVVTLKEGEQINV
ncbi:MAG: 50S ribosomal protein L23 [Anaplasmataceae bacterium]|nr:50S ribosomal protein L23 [Anaplasmataceae bacterium]